MKKFAARRHQRPRNAVQAEKKPPRHVFIGADVPAELKVWVRAWAKRQDMSSSAVIRKALCQFREEQEAAGD